MIPHITTLPSGLRIVTEHHAQAEGCVIGAWIGTGSRLETPTENGIAHFLEHMAFKGTTSRSALDIAETIENVGGDLNAHTAADFTAYYAHVLKDDMPLALDIIADILHNSTFAPDELETEKSVILQEIAQAEDRPDQVASQAFQETAFPHQPLGRSILGTPQNVKGFTPDDFRAFMASYYHPERMVIAATGAISHDKLVDHVSELFAQDRVGATIEMVPATYAGGGQYIARPLQQVSFMVGWEGVSYTHPDYYVMALLAQVLGGGMASRLFQEIREKHGLVYSIYSMAYSYVDTGIFGIGGGTGAEEMKKLTPLLADCLHRAVHEMTAAELDRARAQVRAYLLMSRDSIGSRVHALGESLLLRGRVIPREETLQKINAVTLEDLKDLLMRLLRQKPTVSLVGDMTHAEDYESFAARLRGEG